MLERFLATVDPRLHPLVRELDALVRRAAPDLVASLKWGNLTYHHARNVCALVAHRHHINLQIWGGATIRDPAGLLVGSGRSMRHVKLAAGQAVSRRAVAALIRAAAAASRAQSMIT
jgi:hypothetical protein